MGREKSKWLEVWPDKILRATLSLWLPIAAFWRIIKEIRKRSYEEKK